jgi:hypothetical protein
MFLAYFLQVLLIIKSYRLYSQIYLPSLSHRMMGCRKIEQTLISIFMLKAAAAPFMASAHWLCRRLFLCSNIGLEIV